MPQNNTGARKVDQAINADTLIGKMDMEIFSDKVYNIPNKLVNDLNFNNRTPISIISQATIDS